jgi:hypothetical protein
LVPPLSEATEVKPKAPAKASIQIGPLLARFGA